MLEHLFGLDGKAALVTGGGRGLGKMMAAGLLGAGASRVYIASRDADALRETASELSTDGRCIGLAADLSSEEGCAALAAQLGEREDALHILVNNSGASWSAPLETYPEAGWDKVFQLNVKAPFFLTRALIAKLEAAASPDDPARVINIGSVAGESPDSMGAYAYGLSKSSIHHLTRMLAFELSSRAITVNAIAPGRFPSKMTKFVMDNPKQYEAEVAAIPLRRWGRDDDIAGLAVFLASRAGAYVTGATIPIDGGAALLGALPRALD